MELMASVIIPRHGVKGDSTGLSDFQYNLLNHNKNIVVANAPTGSGKSYAYVVDVMGDENQNHNGKRILFVVPTVRLSKNLVFTFREDIKKLSSGLKSPWDDYDLNNRILAFNQESSKEVRDQGLDAYEYRWKQLEKTIDAPQSDMHKGMIIFTTPEALSNLLLRPLKGANADFGPVRLLSLFDTIVFDESHLLTPRSFGLVALFANLLQTMESGDKYVDLSTGRLKARISLLSATPLDITMALKKLDIEFSEENMISETITQDGSGRQIHGDVKIDFVKSESFLDAVKSYENEILKTVNSEKNVALVIYDSLKQIQVDTSDLQDWRKSIGISDKVFLRDNSIDSQRLDADDAGRKHAMEGKKFIVATSTVEVGITLDGLNLLIMEPGFNLMSFLQRIGRAGRKGENAHIVVCVNDKKIANNPWLSELIQFVKKSDGRLSILEVTKFLQGQSGSTLENTYGELSLRGSYCAAQYWNILTESLENHREKNIFQEKRPSLSRQMWAMLNKIEDKKWIKRFNKEMVNLRNFPPSVTVTGIKKESAEFNVSIPWLFKHTDILETYSLHVGTKNYIYLEGDKDWKDFMRVITSFEDEAKPEGYKRTAWMPLSSSVLIGVYDPVEDYKKRCIKKQNPEDRRRFEAASTLVGLTGVIPYDDGVSDVGSNTAVF